MLRDWQRPTSNRSMHDFKELELQSVDFEMERSRQSEWRCGDECGKDL